MLKLHVEQSQFLYMYQRGNLMRPGKRIPFFLNIQSLDLKHI